MGLYQAGESVQVYDTAFLRVDAQFHGAEHAHRLATISREMPDEVNTYEVAFSDGAEPPSGIASGELLVSVAAIEAGKAAREQRAAARMAEALRLAAQQP